MQLGDTLSGKKTHIACDKGNKKGVGHFVKHLSWWDPRQQDANGLLRAQTQLLDIDASRGTSVLCAEAIKASMNKLKLNDDDDTHKLYGQCTDSGGGGALDSLADEMRELGLLSMHNHLVANCTIHALQLQLRNAVHATFGAGGLDKVNAMQLLHSVCALQESLDLEEWRCMLCKSSLHVNECDPTAAAPEANATATRKEQAQASHKAQFELEFAKVHAFHSKFKTDVVDPDANYHGTMLEKMSQPILTRWWTVGHGASKVFDCYLICFHSCQLIINICGSESSPHKIASTLYSMMKDPETFIDLTLIRCFNKAYLHPHLMWLQESNDLTGALGFQSHQIVIRHHLMKCDLCHIMGGMPEHTEAVKNCSTNSPEETQRHFKKLSIFMKEAFDMLEKHFKRWLGPALLPAALLSEEPLARVVASAMCGAEFPHFENSHTVSNQVRISGRIHFRSLVHKRRICLMLFDKFLRERLEDGVECDQQARVAAKMIVDKVEMRSFDYEGPNGAVRLHMHETHLPLASQTQFVESGVKEAKCVSSTDRSEELRTALAIIRSASPLGKSKIDEDTSYNSSKTMSLIRSALSRSQPHEHWSRNQIDNACDARFNTTLYSMTQGHYKEDRVDAKKSKVDQQGPVFKKQNVTQTTHVPQHQTPAVTGLILYGKLYAKVNGHMDDLKTELLHRGKTPQDVDQWKIKKRKDELKLLEVKRLEDEGVPRPQAEDLVKKHFKKLSTAPFKLTED